MPSRPLLKLARRLLSLTTSKPGLVSNKKSGALWGAGFFYVCFIVMEKLLALSQRAY